MVPSEDKLYPKGNDVKNSVRECINEEIKRGFLEMYVTGKQLFGISVMTIGVLIGVYKFLNSEHSYSLIASLVLFLLSMVSAVLLVLPKTWSLESSADLYDIYNKRIQYGNYKICAWCLFWVLGLIFACVGMANN